MRGGPPAVDPGVRLHVVTGKGGTGKTTVAAALALVLARGGRRVLLVEVEGRQGLAQVLGREPLPPEPVLVAREGVGTVHGLAVDAKAALLEYLEVFYRLGRAGRTLERLGAVDFATTIAPGLRDVLLTGKVYDAMRQGEGGRRGEGPPLWQAVVLDAPPTGRIGRFLNVSEDLAGLARLGPVHAQAEAVRAMVASPATAVHVVTLLEDMPVQETGEAVADLTRLGLPVGALVVNQVRPPLLSEGATAAVRTPGAADPAGPLAGVLHALAEAGVAARDPARVLAGLVGEAREHADRVAAEAEQRRRLLALGRPVVELPQLAGVAEGMDRAALHDLAEVLAAATGLVEVG